MNNFAVNSAWAFAAAFYGATVIGFVPNPLIGHDALFVTNTAHNLVHLLTAIGFTLVARMGSQASTLFMLAFGVVYSLVGFIGFVALGGASQGYLLGIIHINYLDNFLHLGLGAAIAAIGIVAYAKTRQLVAQPAT